MDKATIHFYNKDIWISYLGQGEKHSMHLRIPYSEAQVFFVPSSPHDMSEQWTANPLKILRLGYLQEQIQKENNDD